MLDLGVLWLGPDGELEFASVTARKLLGCEREEDLRLRWPGLKPLIARAGAASDARVRVVDVGGARSLRLECHAEEGGGQLLLVKDRRAVDALETELLLASQMRSQPYAQRVVAHDLKSPLNSIQLSLELLADSLREEDIHASASSRERRQRHVAILREELVRLNRILQGVLDPRDGFGERGGIVDVREAIREIGRLLAPQARRQRVDLDVRVPEAAVEVRGSRDRIRQALLNAGIVALEAMTDGGRLSLGVATDGGAVVTVHGGGTSLPPHIIDALYRNYYGGAGHPGEERLYAARLTVESHGGEFMVESSPEGGLLFRIVLPLFGDRRM